MNISTLVIIAILISISSLTWLVSIWQYDTMMSSMMTFYYNPAALSLFVVIWTAGMAAMMFPAIVPMILVYNRLISTNNATTSNNPGNSSTNSQIAYRGGSNDPKHGSSSTNNDTGYPAEEGGDQSNIMHRLRNTLQSKSPDIILFVSAYLAVWALTGIVLLAGWSYFFDMLLLQLGLNDSQQQLQLSSANTIYGIVLIVAGIYQFSSLKTKCLGYCESPLSFFMRRWRKGRVGALRMGMYHGLYCLGCCWPYFLPMVALGWMNVLWMGLFAAIIFAEKVWTRGGLWIARITGLGFIALGILSATALISLPSDPMSSGDNDDEMMGMTMDMPSRSSDDAMMSMDMSSSSSSS
jgi:predicted metal-binding membrane protein